MRLCGIAKVMFVVSALPALLCGCGEKKKTPAAPPPPPVVQVMKVIQHDVPIQREWVASLDGFVNAQIRAQVGGYLLAQHYQEGTLVKKGDLLFEIDPRQFQAELDKAEAALGKTELDVKRLTPLAQENAVSQQELDDAVQANLANKATVEQARLNLGFTKITAPIDGIAGIAKAQIGDLVSPSSGELTTVSSVDPIKAFFAVSEQEYMYAMAEKGADHNTNALPFELILADGHVHPSPGKIILADRQVDVKTGTLRVAAEFSNPGNLLRPGQFARVRTVIRVLENALLVPQRAVTEMQGMFQVVVVGPDNKTVVRPVKVGEQIKNLWVIEQGLQPDDRVVVEGLVMLKDGVVVNPTPFVPPAQQGK